MNERLPDQKQDTGLRAGGPDSGRLPVQPGTGQDSPTPGAPERERPPAHRADTEEAALGMGVEKTHHGLSVGDGSGDGVTDETDEEPEPEPAPLGLEPAGTEHPEVNAALQRLGDADTLPTGSHIGVYEDVHGQLRDILAALDSRPGPPVPSQARPAGQDRS